MRGGLDWQEWIEATSEQRHRAAVKPARADLRQLHLEGAKLYAANLEGAALREAHLEGANLRDAHLEKALLGGSHLEGADLRWSHLEGAYLIGAHLEGKQVELTTLQLHNTGRIICSRCYHQQTCAWLS